MVLIPGTSEHDWSNVDWSGLAMSVGCQSTDLRRNGCLDLLCPGDQLVDHDYVGGIWLGGIWVGVISEVTPGTL